MNHILQKASDTFNHVMTQHGVILNSSFSDFSIGDKCIIPALNKQGESFANKLFDHLFPRLSSGLYYHYTPFNTFERIINSGNLRFYSTKKLFSLDEFIPLCQDLKLDGYWRTNSNGDCEGEYTKLMDDLFYKSFVACPNTNEENLWNVFADNGSGVRLKVQINIHPDYPDFRQVSYQGAKSQKVLATLFSEFNNLGYHFVPFGISRMPAYYQLKDYAYQNECRLIAKRYPGAHDCFPFQVDRDQSQQCNFIDCSLTSQTCSLFQLHLADIECGPRMRCENRSTAIALFKKFKDQVEVE